MHACVVTTQRGRLINHVEGQSLRRIKMPRTHMVRMPRIGRHRATPKAQRTVYTPRGAHGRPEVKRSNEASLISHRAVHQAKKAKRTHFNPKKWW